MKKLTAILLLFTLLFTCGCQATDMEIGDASADEQSSGNPKQDHQGAVKTTLMIYMIGSDLEAKGAAATKDLGEIAGSGVDLQRNNVIIFTGGSKKWHSDTASAAEHSILRMTADGFVKETAMPNASMGESQSLTNFLNYCYESYPAEEYALIMWDHGNGPIIGYGKDMLFDNDSLTLNEMRSALEASPFKGDDKLAWIGFDACLMASAELACVLDEYANYLVSSQEIEPSFGWNYSFLGDLSISETPELIKSIADKYMQTCEEYYLKKGYTDRDTTLSGMDLSHSAELEMAIDELFKSAEKSIGTSFSVISAKRVETRALGRASTGSEYDLVDVYDLAEQLSDMYPAETARLKAAVDAMTVVNATNTERCCGMSIYFPFYNKTYYEKDWRALYSELGVFPRYVSFLNSYSEKWLGNDLLTGVAQSRLPCAVSEGKYKLELSDEQAANFAEARYYILTKEGKELYNPIFSSFNVTKSGNTITASFDGNIIYFKNNYGEYFIPVSKEFDTVGNITRYGVYANAVNAYANPLYNDYERIVDGYMFHLAADNEAKRIALSALTPWDTQMTAGSLVGGKTEEVDLSKYSKFVFPQSRHLYLKRFENGTVCPLDEWSESSYLSQYHAPIGDGYSFVFAPLTAGTYVLVFEITDTQGNKYCSELLDIQLTDDIGENEFPNEWTPAPPVEVDWNSGDRVELGTHAGVDVSLCVIETRDGKKYNFNYTNNNDFPVYISDLNYFLNGNVYEDGVTSGWMEMIKPGETWTNLTRWDLDGLDPIEVQGKISFGDVELLRVLDRIEKISFTMDIMHAEKCTTLLKDQVFTVNVNFDTGVVFGGEYYTYHLYDKPERDILAGEQVLFEDEELRITLLGFGGTDQDFATDLRGALKIENLGEVTCYVGVDGFAFDDVFVPTSVMSTIPAGSVVYEVLTLDYYKLDEYGVDSSSSLKILFRFMDFLSLEGGGGFSEYFWEDVELLASGRTPTFVATQKELYDHNGVRLSLIRADLEDCTWYISVENNSENDLKLSVYDVSTLDAQLSTASDDSNLSDITMPNRLVLSNARICAGHRSVMKLLGYNLDLLQAQALSFKLCFMDFAAEEAILWDNNVITIELDS